ncbi:hypothetical protein BML2537_34320 [Providencia stuartii]|nr:hypothetical protein BML2537_34320 [Providencia stuartii]GHB94707.1 hypothetical protein GCM10007290_22400 [Providencia thailandensis]
MLNKMIGEITIFNADKAASTTLPAKIAKKNCYFLEKKREFLNFSISIHVDLSELFRTYILMYK